jgi:hypothetical protein
MEKSFELWRTITPSYVGYASWPQLLECGSLLPLLRPKPSLASHTQGGSAAGEKTAAGRRIPNCPRVDVRAEAN